MSLTVDKFEEPMVYQLTFDLDIRKWATMDAEVKKAVSSGWESIKYLNDAGTALSDDIRKLPDDCGGIYLFLLKPDLLPQTHRYIESTP